MKITQETELNKLLKEDGVHGFYLLWGSEEYLIQRWKDKLIGPFAKDGGFNFIAFDGQQLDLNEIYDATQQLPLFASEKCVLVNDVDGKKLVAEEMKKLEQLLQELPPETVFIMTFRANQLDSKSAFGKKIIGFADTYGVSVAFSPRDGQGLVKYLQSIAKKYNCSISSGLAKEMIRLCGQDMLILTNEMTKVCNYANGGELTQEQIDKVVIPKTEEKIFDLGKAILAGNGQRSMEIVDNLLYLLRESPIAIVATLIMSYVDLYRARVAKDQGEQVADVVTKFGYKGREFRVRNAFNHKISKKAIRRSLDLLYLCDEQMKSTSQDTGQLLEQTVLGLLAVRES